MNDRRWGAGVNVMIIGCFGRLGYDVGLDVETPAPFDLAAIFEDGTQGEPRPMRRWRCVADFESPATAGLLHLRQPLLQRPVLGEELVELRRVVGVASVEITAPHLSIF